MITLKVGDKVIIDLPPLVEHICEVVEVDSDGDVRLYHPTKDWCGFYTRIPFLRLSKFNIRLATPLELVLT